MDKIKSLINANKINVVKCFAEILKNHYDENFNKFDENKKIANIIIKHNLEKSDCDELLELFQMALKSSCQKIDLVLYEINDIVDM